MQFHLDLISSDPVQLLNLRGQNKGLKALGQEGQGTKSGERLGNLRCREEGIIKPWTIQRDHRGVIARVAVFQRSVLLEQYP